MKKHLTGIIAAALLAAPLYASPNAPTDAAPKAASAAQQPKALLPSINNPAAAPEIAAKAYIVRDLQSRQTLAAAHADQPLAPASLTKMMTAYLTFKALDEGRLKSDQMLTVSQTGWKIGGSRMFLSPDQPASVDDLIKGMVVQSGNDAAITLAETIGGTVDEFVKQMNAEAKRLGMNRTHFQNPTGLPSEKHLSTAEDLSKLAAALIQDYPQYYSVFSIKSFKYNNIEQPNRNLLLFRDPDIDGLKTGYTESIGYNIAATSKRNGRRVIAVVIGTETTEARAAESSKLLNWALQSFDTPKLYNAGEAVSQVKVYKGSTKSVRVGFVGDAYITVPRSNGNITPVLETEQPVLAPIQKGRILGKLKIMKDDKAVAETDVFALDDVSEANWFGRMWDTVVLWFKSLFGSAV